MKHETPINRNLFTFRFQSHCILHYGAKVQLPAEISSENFPILASPTKIFSQLHVYVELSRWVTLNRRIDMDLNVVLENFNHNPDQMRRIRETS